MPPCGIVPRAEHPPLVSGHHRIVALPKLITMLSKHIGHFEPMFDHFAGASVGKSRRSNGLGVATTVFMDTKV